MAGNILCVSRCAVQAKGARGANTAARVAPKKAPVCLWEGVWDL